MTKRAIPQVPVADQARMRFDQSVKENLEIITGQRVGAIAELDSSATMSEIVSKINEIVRRLQ